jgi:hypothetical protein
MKIKLFFIAVAFFFTSTTSSAQTWDDGYYNGYATAIDVIGNILAVHPEWGATLLPGDGTYPETIVTGNDFFTLTVQVADALHQGGYIPFILAQMTVSPYWEGFYYGFLGAKAAWELGIIVIP